jgi:arabinose-5-phosphate isomerase
MRPPEAGSGAQRSSPSDHVHQIPRHERAVLVDSIHTDESRHPIEVHLPSMIDHIQVARRVLAREMEGLRQLQAGIGASFAAAVEVLGATTGRVTVTGMGKSGLIGKKIAATLASTGTPSQFVHPAEASHGDLGMLTRADSCLALSNSGETGELANILAHCRNNQIPIVAITRETMSTLAKVANVVLPLPTAPEACALGMAPTTSTTCALALGDALAVALMEKSGFDAGSFRRFHPGGTLGVRLKTVADVMHVGSSVPVVTTRDAMSCTLVEMSAKGFGVAIVVEDGAPVGIVTDGDLRRHMSYLLMRTAGEVATLEPKCVPGTMSLSEAVSIMTEQAITSLCVVSQDGRLEGIVRMHDCIRAGGLQPAS